MLQSSNHISSPSNEVPFHTISHALIAFASQSVTLHLVSDHYR